ncbi:hypothetical protein PO25_17535 [Vibrio anguillarum]|uniref:hypothetical protein n=1 Tax=Vibrio anguillarum TaxID=55601 RepID=UPI00097E17CF|nr:hypothetical protein [Vibrio anguillarum]MBT2949674.1 hypothetical protein [Vibrio anguillarum]
MKNLVSACSTEVGIATEVFSVLRAAKFGYQQYRMEQFLQSIQLCTDRMTEDERLEFRNRCLSDTGKRVAADFASAVTDTPCDVVLAAYALLFSSDPDFDFTETQIERFVSSTKGLNTRKTEFFIKLCSLNPSDPEMIYPMYSLSSHNNYGVDLSFEMDEIYAYTQEFYHRGLILPDPQASINVSQMGGFPEKGEWLIRFGISHILNRYSKLLAKAEYLIRK